LFLSSLFELPVVFLGFFICIPAYVVELTSSMVRFRAKVTK
jgi:hypothetical protein